MFSLCYFSYRGTWVPCHAAALPRPTVACSGRQHTHGAHMAATALARGGGVAGAGLHEQGSRWVLDKRFPKIPQKHCHKSSKAARCARQLTCLWAATWRVSPTGEVRERAGWAPRGPRQRPEQHHAAMQGPAPPCPQPAGCAARRASGTRGPGRRQQSTACSQPRQPSERAIHLLVRMKAGCIKRSEREKEWSYKRKRRNHKLKERQKALLDIFFLCGAV